MLHTSIEQPEGEKKKAKEGQDGTDLHRCYETETETYIGVIIKSKAIHLLDRA